MTVVTQQDADQEWAALADKEPAEAREADMQTRYKELAALPDEERNARMKAMATAEYNLPDAKLRSFTISRMRTWLALEHEVAQTIANSYSTVMQGMPAAVAMKRVSLVQTLVMEFTPEEEQQLRELVPTVFAGAPNRRLGLETTGESLQTQMGKKKPFWKFW